MFFAHRGYLIKKPENTVASFLEAIKIGAHGRSFVRLHKFGGVREEVGIQMKRRSQHFKRWSMRFEGRQE